MKPSQKKFGPRKNYPIFFKLFLNDILLIFIAAFKLRGVVVAGFVVNKNGKIKGMQIISGIGLGYNQEVIRT